MAKRWWRKRKDGIEITGTWLHVDGTPAQGVIYLGLPLVDGRVDLVVPTNLDGEVLGITESVGAAPSRRYGFVIRGRKVNIAQMAVEEAKSQ